MNITTLAMAIPEMPAPTIRTSRFCLETFFLDLRGKGRAELSQIRPVNTPNNNQKVLLNRWRMVENILHLSNTHRYPGTWPTTNMQTPR